MDPTTPPPPPSVPLDRAVIQETFVSHRVAPLGRVKMLLMLPVAIVRLLLAALVLLALAAVCAVLVHGVSADAPLGPTQRRVLRVLTSSTARILLVLSGFWCVTIVARLVAHHVACLRLLWAARHHASRRAASAHHCSAMVSRRLRARVVCRAARACLR
jgi:hypothetical protein